MATFDEICSKILGENTSPPSVASSATTGAPKAPSPTQNPLAGIDPEHIQAALAAMVTPGQTVSKDNPFLKALQSLVPSSQPSNTQQNNSQQKPTPSNTQQTNSSQQKPNAPTNNYNNAQPPAK